MPKIAVYPGSFDPPTLGHLDLIERASAQYDQVIVAIGINSTKKPFFKIEDRKKALKECVKPLQNVTVDTFNGLLIQYVRDLHADVIVRGLRATSDFDYEFQIAMTNRKLAPEIETIFLMTKWEHSYLSSSIVREILRLGGDYKTFVPECTIPLLEAYRQTIIQPKELM